MNSEYVPPPKMVAKVPTWLTVSGRKILCPLTMWGTLTVCEVTEAPGVRTGAAWEMINVSPSRVNSAPRVVTKEVTPITAVNTPLMSPTTMQAMMATIRLGTSGRPPLLSS